MRRKSKIGRKYNLLRDTHDPRDFRWSMPAKWQEVPLPPSIDLSATMPACYDQGAWGTCHKADTEVLTDSGWKLFSEATLDDQLATVDPETRLVYFVPPKTIFRLQYAGRMVGVHNNATDFCVTPDHNMLVRRWNERDRTLEKKYQFVRAGDLGWYSGLMVGVKSSTKEAPTYTLPGVEHKQKPQRTSRAVDANAWLGLLGIYLAEGTMVQAKGHYRIQIAAHKEREKEFCKGLFRKLKIHYIEQVDRFYFDDKQIYSEFCRYGLLGTKAPDKFVPGFVFGLGPENMKAVLEGHAAGDGCDSDGTVVHYTSSCRLANDLQRLGLLCGEWGSIYSRPPRTSVYRGRTIAGNFPEYGYIRRNRMSSCIETGSIDNEDYTGMVYCAEVEPYHTLITRRSGKILISGNCYANAVALPLQGLWAHKTMPSRLFVAWSACALEGEINITEEDGIASLRDVIAPLTTIGYTEETMWPYDSSHLNFQPSKECFIDASQHKVISYERVDQQLSTIKAALASGHPIVFGILVYPQLESPQTARDGIVETPGWWTRNFSAPLGGHAIVLCGYDDATERFKFRNSWGTQWGQQGYGYLPYDYVTNSKLSSDFWIIHAVNP